MKIDFSKPVGPFKHLNGINLGPTMNNVYSYELTKELYRKLNCSCVRLHDAPLFNPAMKLVDIHQIFANFNADPDDPANYYFAQTDDYVIRVARDELGMIMPGEVRYVNGAR